MNDAAPRSAAAAAVPCPFPFPLPALPRSATDRAESAGGGEGARHVGRTAPVPGRGGSGRRLYNVIPLRASSGHARPRSDAARLSRSILVRTVRIMRYYVLLSLLLSVGNVRESCSREFRVDENRVGRRSGPPRTFRGWGRGGPVPKPAPGFGFRAIPDTSIRLPATLRIVGGYT